MSEPRANVAFVAIGRQTQERLYAEALRDGVEMTVLTILGRPENGGAPYDGPVPDELRKWCEDVLRRVRSDGAGADPP